MDKFNRNLLGFATLMALSFIHAVNWGAHSFEIIPLKAKSTFGMASTPELAREAEICEDQLKYECAVNALEQVALKTDQAKDFKKLGDLNRRMENWSKSIEAYEQVLAKIEGDRQKSDLRGDSYYGLAKNYENIGDLVLADDFYQKALKAKPGVLQVTVTVDYAKMLKNAGRIGEAKRVVASAERKSGMKGRFSSVVGL